MRTGSAFRYCRLGPPARAALAVAGLSIFLPACAPTEKASLVVQSGRVWTGDEGKPWAEAVAIVGDRIAAVGTEAEIARYVGPETEFVSAAGGMVTPGFIDAHVHLADGGVSLASVDLRDAATPEEFARRIARFAAGSEPGEWILAGAWDHENWGGELPRRQWIDAATADHPVAVTRLDGHMLLANSRALALAGVDRDTAEVEGGTIVRDADGEPTGILKDNAMALVTGVIPPPGPQLLDRRIGAALEHLAGNGVTTAHDMGDWESYEAHHRARAAGRLTVRVYSLVPLADWERLRDEVAAHGRGDEWLRIGGLKGFMDGSLGSHTAAFFEPYADQPGDRGFLVNDPADVRAWIAGADAAGLDVAVHAIGDRAIRELLDIYRQVAAANGPRDRRFRVEHAQHIHPDDLGHFAAQGVVASMQPYHAIDDGRWAEKAIGAERSRTTYAFRSLLDAGTRVAFGSDWYVAPASPLEGIYAAVTRRTLDGAHSGGWVPEQRIRVEEALAAYTTTAAYASFEEDLKGRLAPGMLADLVVLDRDLTAIPGEEIRDARVLATIVGGEVVHWAGEPEEATRKTLHAGRILDVGSGSLLPTSLIRVEEGEIVEIVPWEGRRTPRGAIDLSSYTVLPGLIDAHVHLCDNTYLREKWDPWTLSAPALGILCVVNAEKLLDAGFTTVRNVSEPFYADLAIRDAVAQGRVPGPRIYASGPLIAMTGGHGDWGSWMAPQHDDATPAEAVADGVDEVRKQTREHIKHGVDWIKVAATGGFSSHGTMPGAAAYSTEEMRAAVEEAAKRGLYVAAHAHGAAGIQNAVAAGVRSIEHAGLMDDDSIRLMRENGVFLVADLFGAHYELLEIGEDWSDKGYGEGQAEYDAYAARVARAYVGGVKMAFGTDAGASPHGRGAEQFALLVATGIEPLDAIGSATIGAAELLGIGEKAGTLAPGKWADLIAVAGDPLENVSTLTDVRFVMKGGKVYKRPGPDGIATVSGGR